MAAWVRPVEPPRPEGLLECRIVAQQLLHPLNAGAEKSRNTIPTPSSSKRERTRVKRGLGGLAHELSPSSRAFSLPKSTDAGLLEAQPARKAGDSASHSACGAGLTVSAECWAGGAVPLPNISPMALRRGRWEDASAAGCWASTPPLPTAYVGRLGGSRPDASGSPEGGEGDSTKLGAIASSGWLGVATGDGWLGFPGALVAVFFVTVAPIEGLPTTFAGTSRAGGKSFAVPTSSTFRATFALRLPASSADGRTVGNDLDVGGGCGETVAAGRGPEGGWASAADEEVAVVVGSVGADLRSEV